MTRFRGGWISLQGATSLFARFIQLENLNAITVSQESYVGSDIECLEFIAKA